MAKLTLSDITGGYQTATAYNANNALIEAAFENTLSRDGSTPNQMGADLDMNSYDLNNVIDLNMSGDIALGGGNIATTGQISTTVFVLNGQTVNVDSTLVGGLDASEVTYDPAGANPATSLQAALDDDYVRDDEDRTIAGHLTASSFSADNMYLDSGRSTDGDGGSVQRMTTEGYTGVDWYLGRNVEFGGVFPEVGKAGDGWCMLSMRSDTLDGLMTLQAGDNDEAAGTSIFNASNARINIDGQNLAPAIDMKINESSSLAVNSSGINIGTTKGIAFGATGSSDINRLDAYEEGTFTPTIRGATSDPTQSYFAGAQIGTYTRVGNMCHFQISIIMNFTGVAGGTGACSIEGLPFSADGSSSCYVGIGSAWGLTVGAPTSAYIVDTTDIILLFTYDNDAGNVANPAQTDSADVKNLTTINVSGSYRIA